MSMIEKARDFARVVAFTSGIVDGATGVSVCGTNSDTRAFSSTSNQATTLDTATASTANNGKVNNAFSGVFIT